MVDTHGRTSIDRRVLTTPMRVNRRTHRVTCSEWEAGSTSVHCSTLSAHETLTMQLHAAMILFPRPWHSGELNRTK